MRRLLLAAVLLSPSAGLADDGVVKKVQDTTTGATKAFDQAFGCKFGLGQCPDPKAGGGGGKTVKKPTGESSVPVGDQTPEDTTGDGAGTNGTGLVTHEDTAAPFDDAVKSDPVGSVKRIQDYVDSHPDDPDARVALGRAKRLTGDRAGADREVREALRLDPKNELARREYAFVDEQGAAAARAQAALRGELPEGRDAEAVAVRSSIPKTFPTRSPAEQKAALAALAVAAAGIRPEATPKDKAQALIQSAVSKLEVGDMNGALFELSRALLLDKDNVRARVLRSHINNDWRNKNWVGALKDAEEALKLDPRSAAALFEKGYAELQLGKTADALRDVEEGLLIEPDNAMGRLYHAMILEKVGLIAKAVAEYKEAMRLDPALAPLVEDALGKLRGETAAAAAPAPAAPRGLPKRALVLGLIGLVAAGMLLEGVKRLFAPAQARTTLAPAAASVPVPSATPAVGAMLNESYRIDRELARGGLGVVYEGTDVRLKRRVAIKRMNSEAYASPELRERFLKEAQLAARLRHPNLAEIFSVVGKDELYLVFELVEGETVHERLVKQGPMPLRQVASILSDAAAAIDYAHGEKVIHRDLKPANLMLKPDGRVKVLDFGIAHETARNSGQTMTQAWGTPPYMAPEQETGSVCRESDVYALGVVAYELLTGRRPFDGGYLLTMKIQKQYRPATEAVPTLPKGVDAFFDRALDPDPAKRFRTASELARALASLAATTPASPA